MIGWRDLAPMGRAITVLAVVVAVLIGAALIARTWDGLTDGLPWSDESRLTRAEARLERLQTDLDARTAEVAALERQVERTATAHRTLTQARTITVRAATLAEAAPDANDPIDPFRADRLRDADWRLCELSPDLCATPDQPAAAGS